MTKTNYWLERVVTKINKKSDRSTISEDIKTLTFRSYLQFIILCVVIAVLNSGTIYVAKLLNHKMLIMQSTISAIPISSCDNISNKDILQDCLKSGADKADMRASKEYFSYYKNSIRASMPIIPSNKVMADFKVATQEFKEYVDNKHTEQFMSIGVNDGLTELLSLKHNLSIPYEIFITALWANFNLVHFFGLNASN